VKLPLVEAQTHRRFLKTHLPVDALRFSPKAKYLYIGHDGRDVVRSMYNTIGSTATGTRSGRSGRTSGAGGTRALSRT
jgi:hypothetical protein